VETRVKTFAEKAGLRAEGPPFRLL
jgi:hypothetical protein